MNTKKLIFAALLMIASSANAQKYVGGDISLLPEYEKVGSTYKYHDGTTAESALQLFKDEKLNTMRLRLFVNPSDYPNNDKNCCQTLDYVKTLGKRIKDSGFKLMLDFHYSDTWADPAKQWTPKAWENLSDEELYTKIYDYTKDVLQQMKEAGAEPEFIQTGNEISYGMLWGKEGSSNLKKCYVNDNANWDRFTTLLKNAGKACREVCPQAKIIIHSERVAQSDVLIQFFKKINDAEVDYDIIGLSYYMYYHGKTSLLETAVTQLESNYPDKKIMVVEFGYPYAWKVEGTKYEYLEEYPYTDDGQKKLTDDVIAFLKKHENVNGLFWWWMEYNPYKDKLQGWYNAPLFDGRTGCATSALSSLKDFLGGESGIHGIEADASINSDNVWTTLSGIRTSKPSHAGLYIHNGKKVVVR